MLQLRYYQREALDSLYAYWSDGGGNGLIVLPTGCHAPGTDILMHDGSTKKVELVAANDNVMGPDSNPRKVLRLIRGREPMYRITPRRGAPFVVNENHILSLKTTNEGAKADKFPNSYTRGGEVENIRVADYLGKSKSWKHLRKLWRTGVDFPANDNQQLPIPAWILGVMLGDGSTKHGPNLTGMDPEIMDPVCEYIESLGLRIRHSQKAGNRSTITHFVDDQASRSVPNRFTALLRSVGVWGCDAGTKFIPPIYKNGSRATRLEVLAGLLDTDGHLSKGYFDFISKSQHLANDVTFVARSLGLAAYCTSCEKRSQHGNGGTYWRVTISGDVDVIPTRTPRKQAGRRRQIKNSLVTGFDIEPIGDGEFFGFELDGDHLYLTGDFTVHHNSGKALVIAKLIEELLAQYPDMRILNVTHSANLVGQNFKEFIGLSPFAPAGIYSAGLGRRDAHAQILFCGIQSIWNKVDQLGEIDLVIVDEAHAISRNSNTQYGKFFRDVRRLNPDSRTCGTTATDYRMDSGRLTDELDDDDAVDLQTGAPVRFRLFDDVVYEAEIGKLMEEGYLTRLTSTKTATKIDLKGVGTRGGEYIPGQISDAAERIIEEAVAEDMAISADRRAGLFFSTSKENARHIAEAIRRHGRTCAVLTSDNAHEEDRIFSDFRAGAVWAISSVSKITTGTNFPFVDFISLILSTKSPGKLVQILGRGTRNCEGKHDCLIADHGKNLAYHGPIDQIRPKAPGKGEGEQPRKRCPDGTEPHDKPDENGAVGCGELIPISVMTCHCCGYVFPPSEEEKITAQADNAPVLSTEKPWFPVKSRNFYHHPGKPDGAGGFKPDTVKISYLTGMKTANEWVGPGSKGFMKSKADRYWLRHGGARPFPTAVIEWIERAGELAETEEIQLDFSKNAKYPDVANYRIGAAPVAVANDNRAPAANDNSPSWASDIDDFIPF